MYYICHLCMHGIASNDLNDVFNVRRKNKVKNNKNFKLRLKDCTYILHILYIFPFSLKEKYWNFDFIKNYYQYIIIYITLS